MENIKLFPGDLIYHPLGSGVPPQYNFGVIILVDENNYSVVYTTFDIISMPHNFSTDRKWIRLFRYDKKTKKIYELVSSRGYSL